MGHVVPIAPARQEAGIAELRRKRVALEEANRQIMGVGMQEHRSLTLRERQAIAANIEEIRGIKDTLRAFGALYQ
ncbi:MAG: hypothetical protein Q7R80_00140 [bacterium]|nr:hypothetical protein [bacterium]